MKERLLEEIQKGSKGAVMKKHIILNSATL